MGTTISEVVIDASAIIALIDGESEAEAIAELILRNRLLSPASLPYEIGNALISSFKRNKSLPDQVLGSLSAYSRITIRKVDIDLPAALRVAMTYGLYAYDAYVLQCAIESGCPLLTLDRRLLRAAQMAGVETLEVFR